MAQSHLTLLTGASRLLSGTVTFDQKSRDITVLLLGPVTGTHQKSFDVTDTGQVPVLSGDFWPPLYPVYALPMSDVPTGVTPHCTK